MVIKCRNFATLPMKAIFLREINFQKVTRPRVHTWFFTSISALHVIWGQVSHAASPHYMPMGECWNWNFCNINDIIRNQTHQILLSYILSCFFSLLLDLWRLCNVTDDAPRVFLGYQSFSSITSEKIKIESRERHRSAGTALSNLLICSLPPP